MVLAISKVKFDLPVKSKIYIATAKQIDTVMQGRRIDQDTPMLTVEKSMQHTTILLHPRAGEGSDF